MMKPEERSESLSLFDRIFAGLMAPFFMNISVIIILASVFRRGRYLRRFLLRSIEFPFDAGKVYFIGTIILPCVVGLILGSEKIITLIGHCFLSNPELSKNSVPIAIALWAFILGISYLIAQTM